MEGSTEAPTEGGTGALTPATEAPEASGPADESGSDQPTDATSAEAPGREAGTSAGDSEGGEGFETPFNINEVPEAVREHVERYANQLKSAYSRKTAELAESNRVDDGTRERLSLLERLEGEDGLDALNELAEALGYEEAGEIEEGEEPSEGELDPREKALEELRAEIAELKGAEQSRQSAQQSEAIQDRVLAGIDDYASERGVEELPEDVVKALMLTALSVPYGDDGLPDMGTAVEVYQAAQQAELGLYLESVKARSGDAPELSGSSGVEKPDFTDRRTRLDHANRLAARHVG